DFVFRQHAPENTQGGPVRVSSRRHVIGGDDRTDRTDSAQKQRSLSVRRRRCGGGGVDFPSVPQALRSKDGKDVTERLTDAGPSQFQLAA
ncbi:MAG: hypothetical protein ACK56G_20850, partial [Pirellulaceae bacterium]